MTAQRQINTVPAPAASPARPAGRLKKLDYERKRALQLKALGRRARSAQSTVEWATCPWASGAGYPPLGGAPLLRGVPFGAVTVWGVVVSGIGVRGVPFGAVVLGAGGLTVPGMPGVVGVPGAPGELTTPGGGAGDGAAVEGAVVTDGAPVEGDVADGAAVEGDVPDGAPVEGEVADGVVVEGDVVADGAAIEGDETDGAPVEGDVAEGAPVAGEVVADGAAVEGPAVAAGADDAGAAPGGAALVACAPTRLSTAAAAIVCNLSMATPA
jgi:hypothetical protein